MQWIKLSLGMIVLAIWGGYLIYIWANPAEVPQWAQLPGMRRALMLNHGYQPTAFTLMFGIGFSGLVLFCLFKLATGTSRLQLGRDR